MKPSLRARIGAFFHPPQSKSSEDILREIAEYNRGAAGAPVTETTAMSIAAFYAGVRVLAESIASLPLHLYRVTDTGKEVARNRRLYRTLHEQPNSWQTSFEFRELMMYWLLLRGNAYAYITSGTRGVELLPIDPDKIEAEQLDNYRVLYRFYPDGKRVRGTTPRIIRQDQMLHIRFLSDDGIEGKSIIKHQRETLSGSIAMTEHGHRLFANGATPGVVLSTEQKLNKESIDRLRAQWEETHAGAHNAHKTAILEQGLQATKLTMTSEDAQWIESRKMSRSDVAGILRIPPHMIGDLERSTFSNIEHQGLEFVVHSLRPWLVRWEQALQRDVIRDNSFFARFNVDGLVRGDIKSRYEAYAIGRNWGWLSVNDIRDREDMNPVEDGDEYLRPLNMEPIGDEIPEALRTEEGNRNAIPE